MEAPRSLATALVFLAYMVGVAFLAVWAGRFLSKPKSFVSEYFLGDRSMSSWALAMSFAATCISGGTFAGFPALIYMHGWIMFLWIGSYMVFPLVAMGLMGKRLNQLSHRTGAITIPDILRDRFDSPALAIFASFAIIFFMTVNLVAQFKSGAVILDVLLSDTPGYRDVILPVFQSVPGVRGLIGWTGPGYVFSLLLFSATVVLYTMYGGFRAVVWTDVLQGVVMLLGVLILLPTVLIQVGGLKAVTQAAAEQPAEAIVGKIAWRNAIRHRVVMSNEPVWIEYEEDDSIDKPAVQVVAHPEEKGQIVRVKMPGKFAVTQAQDVVRLVNEDANARRLVALEVLGEPPTAGSATPSTTRRPLLLLDGKTRLYGPSQSESGKYFHPLGMAISFFFFWSFSGAGHPGFLVRLMAFRNSRDLRYSMVTVTIYFALIYIPLVFIFIAARSLISPAELPAGPDSIMPTVATRFVHPLLAGVLIAAPYSAVMSTVSSFLLVISSSLVRDFYQRTRRGQAHPRMVEWLSYLATGGVGLVVTVLALDPPLFLQDIVVFSSSGISATFLMATLLAIYWPRMTLAGAWGAMLAGFFVVLGAHLPIFVKRLGWGGTGEAVTPLGLDPFVWACALSLTVGWFVSLLTKPTSGRSMDVFFGRPGADVPPVVQGSTSSTE